MLIDHEKTLRETIIETLVPERDEVVGYMCEDPKLQKIGWWVNINGIPAFFGKSFKDAIFTAKRGDWFVPNRDGTLTGAVVDWFERRAQETNWEDLETQDQKNARRERILLNTEYTTAEPPKDYRSELDTGVPISSEEMARMLNQSPPEEAATIRREWEILRIIDLEGLWIVDDELENITRVNLILEEDGYRFTLHERKPAAEGMQMRTVARLRVDSEDNFIFLKVFSEDQKIPSMVIRRGKTPQGADLLKVEKFTLS